MDSAIGRQQQWQFSCAFARLPRRFVFAIETPRQMAHQRLQIRIDPTRRNDGPAPGGNLGIWIGAKVLAPSWVKAGLEPHEAAEPLGRRQIREFLVA